MTNASARLEDFANVLGQRDVNSFFIECPGARHHTTPTGTRDCIAYLSGAPTAHCVHANCRDEVDALSLVLRRAFPSGREIQRHDSRPKIDYIAVRATRKAILAREGKIARDKILAEYPWSRADICEGSPCRFYDAPGDVIARQFLAFAFEPDDLLFIGHPERSTEWGSIRASEEWIESPDLLQRPALCPNSLRHRNKGRRKENVASVRYCVFEADGLSADAGKNQDLSGSLIRWARERLGLNLFAIVDSGNKSLHAWFAADSRLRSFLATPDAAARLSAIGFDPAALRPAQTFRNPGHTRQDTGRVQSLLYFDPAASIRGAVNTSERK